MWLYIVIIMCSVFLSSVSQVMLKKATMREHGSFLREYLNPLVIGAYALFFLTTLLTLLAYRKIPLSLGPVLESTAYFYVTIFGLIFFKEKITIRRIAALTLIVIGIIIFSLG